MANRYVELRSKSLIIRKMQIKITDHAITSHLLECFVLCFFFYQKDQTSVNASEDMEGKESLYTADRNAMFSSYYRSEYGGFSKIKNINLKA